jgi:hypothetical protein
MRDCDLVRCLALSRGIGRGHRPIPHRKTVTYDMSNAPSPGLFQCHRGAEREGRGPLMMGVAPSSLRALSKGSFEATCGRCFRLSHPVDAMGPEHAWSELIKDGWTWHTGPVEGAGYTSCLECLRVSALSHGA